MSTILSVVLVLICFLAFAIPVSVAIRYRIQQKWAERRRLEPWFRYSWAVKQGRPTGTMSKIEFRRQFDLDHPGLSDDADFADLDCIQAKDLFPGDEAYIPINQVTKVDGRWWIDAWAYVRATPAPNMVKVTATTLDLVIEMPFFPKYIQWVKPTEGQWQVTRKAI